MNNERTSMTNWFGSRGTIVLLLFLAMIGFYLFEEHRLHLFGILPYLLLLACPLMHILMHRSHGKSGHDVGKHH